MTHRSPGRTLGIAVAALAASACYGTAAGPVLRVTPEHATDRVVKRDYTVALSSVPSEDRPVATLTVLQRDSVEWSTSAERQAVQVANHGVSAFVALVSTGVAAYALKNGDSTSRKGLTLNAVGVFAVVSGLFSLHSMLDDSRTPLAGQVIRATGTTAGTTRLAPDASGRRVRVQVADQVRELTAASDGTVRVNLVAQFGLVRFAKPTDIALRVSVPGMTTAQTFIINSERFTIRCATVTAEVAGAWSRASGRSDAVGEFSQGALLRVMDATAEWLRGSDGRVEGWLPAAAVTERWVASSATGARPCTE